jgi:hypothetical protein
MPVTATCAKTFAESRTQKTKSRKEEGRIKDEIPLLFKGGVSEGRGGLKEGWTPQADGVVKGGVPEGRGDTTGWLAKRDGIAEWG